MLVNTYPFTKYSGIDAILVAIHQYQLSTFFLVISHMPVNAEADANASAQGIAPGAKLVLRKDSAAKMPAHHAPKNNNSLIHSLPEDQVT